MKTVFYADPALGDKGRRHLYRQMPLKSKKNKKGTDLGEQKGKVIFKGKKDIFLVLIINVIA